MYLCAVKVYVVLYADHQFDEGIRGNVMPRGKQLYVEYAISIALFRSVFTKMNNKAVSRIGRSKHAA